MTGLREVEAKTLTDRLAEVKAEALVDALGYKLEGEKLETLSKQLLMRRPRLKSILWLSLKQRRLARHK